MSRGRAAAIAIAFVALISLLGACGSGSSGSDIAAADRRAAAQNKAAAARTRLAVARFRATQARHRARLATTTTTIVTQAEISPADDLAAITNTVAALNAAFDASVAAGITSSATANHWVDDHVYSGTQCMAFESARGQGIVAERLALHPSSLSPSPGWVDPVVGKVPRGRIYRIAIDEIQTLVPTGQQRARTLSVHVTVQSDGNARFFLRCR
ncbi:MAG: hypothetical protein QOI44_2352 [Actinomycetota bacterium]|jgi:hypothetical protein|nr:hypothetical protein [Actinomycetota bacterium]